MTVTDKDTIRNRVWDRLEAEELARFPFPPHGRITNFDGGRAAAERATETPELASAEAVKANPDAPQLPLRRSLLKAGTTLYMAVPRLGEETCFVELDPETVSDPKAAPTISHMGEHGQRVRPDAVPELDAIVVGSVAVTEGGDRVGKGEGYSDLEFAILRELGLVGDDTPVVTTVHDVQVVDDDVPTRSYDVPVDVVCTPTRTFRTGAGEKPAGIDWSLVDDERRESIPVLQQLAAD